ncbi:tRNA pseudouridine(13) synthase TruD [Pseudomonas sp. F1_0610]|uniref:tRNA pseudouridine(13) synthase TruD n=1 Tax=Pseudomonas sp. F1_0610 TaxID=3114284 RepID=UPI0039C2CBC5
MTELELLGPYAFGVPSAKAILKATPADFQVEEQLDIALSGEGEHLWLWVEKQGLNTEEVAIQLSKRAKLPVRAISYAGLKDRQAITRQWFSLHLPGRQDPDFTTAETEQWKVLHTIRHHRKLQRGAHKSNTFVICLQDFQGNPQQLEERLNSIKQQGVPNYYGTQRFGREGFNLLKAQEFAEQKILPDKRHVRSRLLSSARSFLFNQVLALRVRQGIWNQIVAGDLIGFSGSHSFFPASELQANDPRFTALDIHPTLMLWGKGHLATTALAHQLETAIAIQNQPICAWLENAGLEQERRISRLVVSDLRYELHEHHIQLAFSLPVGSFATVVLRELVQLETINEGLLCAY